MSIFTSPSIQNVFGYEDVFIGDFILKGSLRLDGFLKGRIITDANIYVSQNGYGLGIFKASTIDIRGVIKGDIYASNLVIIRSTAIVKGKIYSSFIEVEEGGTLIGICSVSIFSSRHDLASYLIQNKKKEVFKLEYSN